MSHAAVPRFDAELLARHDRPGPRYTSYPTAPQFSPDFGEGDLRAAIARSNEEPLPRALSLYVPSGQGDLMPPLQENPTSHALQTALSPSL